MRSLYSSMITLMVSVALVLFSITAAGQTTTPNAGYSAPTVINGTSAGQIALSNVLLYDMQGPDLTSAFSLYSNPYINWQSSQGDAKVRAGQIHHLSIRDGDGSGLNRYIAAWVDFNQDGDFTDPGEEISNELFGSFGYGSFSVLSQYFQVPAGAVTGNTVLRVACVYNSPPTNPDGTYSYAQFFDYNLEVLPACSPVTPPNVFDGGNVVQAESNLVQITNVSLEDINNISLAFGTNTALYNYSNFTGVTNTDLESGQSYTIDIERSQYQATAAVWIDWNNDGDFLDVNEEIGMEFKTGAFNNNYSFSFTAPSGIPNNTVTTMRVRMVYDDVTSSLTPTNTTWSSSASNTNNETEDYAVTLINSGCTITAGTATLDDSDFSCDQTVDLEVTGYTGTASLQWLRSTDGTTFNPISGATSATYTDGPLTTGTYYYKVEATDGCTVSSNVVSVSPQVITQGASGSQSVTTCGATYYDEGGAGSNYFNVTNSTVTIYPCNPSDKVEVDFSSFYIETNWDYMYIYDGNSTSAPQIGTYTGTNSPGTVTSTASDGSLTFEFFADGSVNAPGWAADVSCVAGPSLVCQPVSNLTAAIGDPANGTAHHIDVSWDVLTGATEYDVEYSTDGSTWNTLATVTTNSYDHNTGDNPNAPYYYRVRASDGTQNCNWATMSTPIYTAADQPELVTLNNVASNTMDVSITPETPVANPAYTEYTIQEENGQYVQANGALGASPVWQTASAWANTTVTGLSNNTEYCFVAAARNQDGDVRGGSISVLAPQPFNSDVITNGFSGSNSAWFGPTSNTPAFDYSATGGCPGGAASANAGSFNGFWGNFLRTPAVDLSGQDEATLRFDLTNNYTSGQDQNYFRFYLYHGPTSGGTYVDAVDFEGNAPVGINDVHYITQSRNCETVEATFDLTGIPAGDKSNLLFYLEANSGYNNSNALSVAFDNIEILSAAPSTCATTSAVTNTVWTGNVSDDWFVSGNWTNGVPTSTIDAVIPDVTPNPFPRVLGPGTAEAKDVNIDADASVEVTIVNNPALEIYGDLNHSGNPDMGAGEVVLVSSATHAINGDATIGKLTIANNTAINGNVDLKDVLSLQSGVLNTTGGTFTILSDATQTGMIDDFSSGFTGTINGNVTVQRYLPASTGAYGYHHIGSPVNNLAVANLNGLGLNGASDQQIVPQSTCDPTAIAQGSPYANLLYWKEDATFQFGCDQSGWFTKTAGNLDNARGYAANVSNGGATITMTGNANTGPQSYDNLANTTTVGDGWHLVSNPYQSSIIWNNPAGFNAEAQLWNDNTGTYDQILAGTGAVIAPNQGFFVKVSGGTPVDFTLDNNDRSLQNASFMKSDSWYDKLLTLTVSGNGFGDKTRVYFSGNATANWDDQYDAHKMESRHGQPTLYTRINGYGELIGINGFHTNGLVNSVPMGMLPGADGSFTISVDELEGFDASQMIYLEDTKTGSWTNLRLQPDYTFNMTTAEANDRFVLHFTAPVEVAALPGGCETHLGTIVMGNEGEEPWSYQLYDGEGNLVADDDLSARVFLDNMSEGEYTLQLVHDNGIEVTKTVTLDATDAVTADFEPVNTTVNVGEAVSFNNSSYNGEYFGWDFGNGTFIRGESPQVTYTEPGVYEVTLTVKNGFCEDITTRYVQVEEQRDVTGVDSPDEAVAQVTIFAAQQKAFINFSDKLTGADAQISVFDVLGRKVTDEQRTAEKQVVLNLDRLVAGAYIVRVMVNGEQYNKQVFIGE